MKRAFLTLALFGLIGSLPFQAAVSSAGTETVILAARRGGDVEFIDSQTLQTLGSLHFSLTAQSAGLNGVSLSADGSTLYVDGPTPSDPLVCCVLYSVDLATFQARVAASIQGTASRDPLIRSDGVVYPASQLITGNPIRRISDDLLHLSLGGEWLFGVKSFRGPAIETYDLARGGAHQELRPGGLTGDWWPSGTWSGGLFYLNVWSSSGGRLWTVAPGTTQLDAGVPLTQPDGCSPTSISGITAAGGKLFLYETFGFKVDQTNACGGSMPGGMWIADPATGRLSEKMATEYHFSYLLADRQGTALYGLDSGSPHWQNNVRLMRIDPATGNTLATRTLDSDFWRIAVVPMAATPAGPQNVWQ
jgi:hypothetical protein